MDGNQYCVVFGVAEGKKVGFQRKIQKMMQIEERRDLEDRQVMDNSSDRGSRGDIWGR